MAKENALNAKQKTIVDAFIKTMVEPGKIVSFSSGRPRLYPDDIPPVTLMKIIKLNDCDRLPNLIREYLGEECKKLKTKKA